MSRRKAPLRRVLSNPALRRLELAFLCFGIAEYGVWVAVLVYAYQRGGATLAGVIAVAQLIPAAVVAPLASRSADFRGPGRMLRFGYAVQALTLAATASALLGGAPPAVVYVFAVAAASEVTLIRPAQSTLLPMLVSDPADLTAANSVTGWVESVSVLIGPAFAGLMIGIDGPGAAVAVFAAAMFVGAVLVMPLGAAGGHPVPPDEVTEAGPDASSVITALRRDKGVSLLLGLGGVQFMAIGALDVLEVVLAVGVLGLGASGAGYLGAAYGAGGVLGAAGTLALIGRRRLTGSILAAVSVFASALIALGIWPSVASAFALLCLVGASRSVFDVAGRTMLHRVIPTTIRGRVFGAQEGLAMLGLAIGSILVPPLVHAGGAEAALVAVGGLLAAATLLSAPSLALIERDKPSPSCELVALRRSPLFTMLAPPALEDLARALVARPVTEGEVVVREGDPGRLFYLIADGELDVSIGGRYVRTLGAGDGFGEIALLRGGLRTATVTACRAANLYTLEREPFIEATTGSYHAHRAVEQLVADRLADDSRRDAARHGSQLPEGARRSPGESGSSG